ncbi:hypothetical protein LCGC14_0504140 [marine sediment metagenome]|uniref:NTP pyrophosphohydrolase MazG putative catalytic core domain-containing protein n=1 Tax=marine sediment metagenome TaxID=412755 RepID=A0A0F9S851_9ZZZZ
MGSKKEMADQGFPKHWWPKLFNQVRAEHNRQIKKWGHQIHHGQTWMGILGKEIGELHEAMNNYCMDAGSPEYIEVQLQNVIDEAVQVSTLALKIASMAMYKLERKNYG